MSKGTGEFKDARQTGLKNLFTQMVEFQLGVWAPWTVTATTFTDFDHDRTRHHVTTRQVFRIRGITLHKALTVFVQQVTAFTTATFSDQNPCPGDTGWVELPHFHILHRYTGTDCHANAVTGIDMRVGGGLVNTACAAGRQHGGAGLEVNHFTGFDTQRGTTDHCAIGIFDQIQRVPLRENGGMVFRFC